MQSMIWVMLVCFTSVLAMPRTPKFSLTPVYPHARNFKLCKSKVAEGLCGLPSYCSDQDNQTEYGFLFNQIELRTNSAVEWCCSEKNITPRPPSLKQLFSLRTISYKPCITRSGEKGRCVYSSHCNDQKYEIERGGIVDESELR